MFSFFSEYPGSSYCMFSWLFCSWNELVTVHVILNDLSRNAQLAFIVYDNVDLFASGMSGWLSLSCLWSYLQCSFSSHCMFSWWFFSWNEWVTLPVMFSDLPRNAQLAFTVYDTLGPSKIQPVGGSTISLFGKHGVFRQVWLV